MTDLLAAFVIICAAIRPVHMLMRLPAARARRWRIQQFYQSSYATCQHSKADAATRSICRRASDRPKSPLPQLP